METRVLITLPVGDRDTVDICIQEIAAMREHQVVSYSYQRWTEITLNSGTKFDCHVTRAEVRAKIDDAMRKAVV